MEWVLPALNLLVPLARIYDRKHKTKYLSELLDLRSAIREEENRKNQGLMVNHARVDSMSSRVRDIMEIFGPFLEGSNLEVKEG